MYTVKKEFSDAVDSLSVTAVAKIIIKDSNLEITGKASNTTKSSIQELTIKDNCCNQGKIFGTVMAKEVEIKLINKDHLNLADKEFELYVGVKLANGEISYIPYGTYIITEYQDTKSNNIYKIIAYDYMTKLNSKFEENAKFNPTYPITLKEFTKQFLSSYNLEYEDKDLPNDNFLIQSKLAFSGKTARAILGNIAELQGTFAKVNRFNKVEFVISKPKNLIKDSLNYSVGNPNYLRIWDFSNANQVKDTDIIYQGKKVVNILGNWQRRMQRVRLKNDTVYTLSAFIKNNDEAREDDYKNNPSKIGYYGLTDENHICTLVSRDFENGGIVPKEWTRISVTFRTGNKTDFNGFSNIRLEPYVHDYQNHKPNIYMCGLQLEEGEEATEYDEFTSEKITENSMNSKLEINQKYGGINSLSFGMSNIKGEETTIKDIEDINKNGEISIVINDNPFVYTKDLREKAIKPLFNAIKGFSYYPVKFNYKSRLYLDCGDEIYIKNTQNNEYVKTIIMNQTIKIPGTRKSTLESPALTKTQTENKYITQEQQQRARTEIIVDEQNKKITSVVEEIGDRSNKSTTITQELDSITSKVQNFQDVAKKVSGNKKVNLEKCVEGDILELNIKGNNTVFKQKYPANDLYPSDTLFPEGDSFIKVTNENGESVIYNLGVLEVLRQKGKVYDEYIANSESAKVIRRIDKNGDYLSIEKVEPLELVPIKLFKGENTVEIVNYDANLTVKYAYKNDYTDIFTTKVEMTSEIKQTAEEINLEVAKKVDSKEIISTINQTAEQVKIKAQKIALEGIVTANENFKILEDGSIEAKNGTFSGNIILGDGSEILGGRGLLSNLNFNGKGQTIHNPIGDYNYVGIDDNQIQSKFEKSSLVFDVLIPQNFTVTKAELSFTTIPLNVNNSAKSRIHNLRLYKSYLSDSSSIAWTTQGEFFPYITSGLSDTGIVGIDTPPDSMGYYKYDITQLFIDNRLRFELQTGNELPGYDSNPETGWMNNAYTAAVNSCYISGFINVIGYLKVNKEE